jgi:hypothetical protein
MEYQQAVRIPVRQLRKVAAEITSFMKRFIYVEKEKRF